MIIKMLRRTAAEWVADNPLLTRWTLGFEMDTGKTKLGNGVDRWNGLAYHSEPGGGGGASAFTDLTDAPATYVGHGGALLCVGDDETSLVYVGDANSSVSIAPKAGYPLNLETFGAGDELNVVGNGPVNIGANGVLTIGPNDVTKILGLPTSDPAVSGALWNDAGTLKISAG